MMKIPEGYSEERRIEEILQIPSRILLEEVQKQHKEELDLDD